MKTSCLRPVIGAIIGSATAWLFCWPPKHSHSSGSDMINGLDSLAILSVIILSGFAGTMIGFIANRIK